MTDYKKYINALRKYARMLEDDRTSIWNIVIPGLLKNTANLFNCKELECGKEWDGHTGKDVTRLLSLEKKNRSYCKCTEPRKGVIDTNKSLCDSCTNNGCILQTGIIRNNCHFYKTEREE